MCRENVVCDASAFEGTETAGGEHVDPRVGPLRYDLEGQCLVLEAGVDRGDARDECGRFRVEQQVVNGRRAILPDEGGSTICKAVEEAAVDQGLASYS